ncbi:MAG: PorT family protein [Bacteroidetes bacterium]|nr:PorT family protein [Bacteroidota bacterium]MCL1969113.1 PorT family protein [Bacteroidota bacterium]
MRKLLFIIVILFCCNLIFAQKTPQIITVNKKWYAGLSLGPTIDWFIPTNELMLKPKKAKAGFIAGINLDVNCIPSNMLYISTGVLFRYLNGDLAFLNNYDYNFPDTTYTLTLSTVRTYRTMYITIPTGVKFRTNPSRNCVFSGKMGLYHNFKIGGSQVDNFVDPLNPNYYQTTATAKNSDASLFAEAAYFGIGFEYEFAPKIRVFANTDYSCQLNYFSSKAKSNVSGAQFKSLVHSLQITFGVLF